MSNNRVKLTKTVLFREGHDEFDLEDHKPAIFKKTAKHKKYNMEF